MIWWVTRSFVVLNFYFASSFPSSCLLRPLTGDAAVCALRFSDELTCTTLTLFRLSAPLPCTTLSIHEGTRAKRRANNIHFCGVLWWLCILRLRELNAAFALLVLPPRERFTEVSQSDSVSGTPTKRQCFSFIYCLMESSFLSLSLRCSGKFGSI